MAVWQPYQAAVPNMQFGIVVYGKNFLQDHPETGIKFMTAYLKAVRQYNLGKTDRNVTIMAKYTKLDPALLKRACWPAVRSDGAVSLATILDFQAWGVKQGSVQKAVTAEALWDSRFVDAANQTLGK
jgi:NitT/TauT family transport system substrate-binding protein